MRWPVKRYRIEQEVPLPRWRVWELLANTDHLNRLIGLFSIRYSAPSPDSSLFYREIQAKVAGLIPLKWKELPFEWTKNQYYSVEREYLGGPLERFNGGVALEDAETMLPGGDRATKVKLFADFTPSNALGMIAIPLVGKRSMKKTLAYCSDYLKMVNDGHAENLPQPSFSSKANAGLLEEKVQKLSGFHFNRSTLERLKSFIVQGGDEEVANMRPYELAIRWNVDKNELLRLCLYATKEGLLNLSWELMCPNCRVSKSRTESLSQLEPKFHCDLCGIEYEANFDRYVELRFSVAPAIRKASRQVYCIGGPFITPHVFTQSPIDDKGIADISIPNYQGEMRLRTLGSNDVLSLTSDVEDSHEIRFLKNGWNLDYAPRPVAGKSLRVENKSGKPIVVVLEEVEWDKQAVTAAEVSAMQEFRDLFSSEVLAPDQQIQVGNVTLLFSDLKGSTALYEIVGDAHAYSNVRRHFDFLSRWVNAHSGAVVKTMGDAVMAVFYKPEDAIRAAYDIYERLGQFNGGLPKSEQIAVKMGIHCGPAIVVNSNDRIDYFGRTVNLAARIQGTSSGDGFVLSRELFERKGILAFLTERDVTMKWFRAELKGIDEKAELVKISL